MRPRSEACLYGTLALYEAPFIVDNTRTPLAPNYLAHLREMIVLDRRGEAVKYCIAAVQVPKVFVVLTTILPSWKRLMAAAPTLVHDMSLMDGLQSASRCPHTGGPECVFLPS